ncbi:MAG: Plasmid stabilization system protein [Mucilaginibacter sp.]|nr:Plasmid stabilization system protein [Mucilaginibacter sp.]
MYRTVVLPLAKQDIKEAALWYNSKQKDLGKRFITELRQKINLIKQNPYTSANRYDEVRTAVLEIFPFMIHYTIDEVQKLIVIFCSFTHQPQS